MFVRRIYKHQNNLEIMSLTLLKVTEEGEVVDTGIHKNQDDLEKCVMCHAFTAVRRSTPIDQRKYYIKGAGQAHKECYEYINGERSELPSLVTLYEPTPTEILRKRGFRAFLTDFLRNF